MSNISVLLVEDNGDDEFLALRALRKLGYKNVAVARDGKEAITMLIGDESAGKPAQMDPPPAIILLDLRLPKLDGLEVLRELRRCERTRDSQVYVLTSSEDPYDREICTNLGALAFIPKPLTVDSFISASSISTH